MRYVTALLIIMMASPAFADARNDLHRLRQNHKFIAGKEHPCDISTHHNCKIIGKWDAKMKTKSFFIVDDHNKEYPLK